MQYLVLNIEIENMLSYFKNIFSRNKNKSVEPSDSQIDEENKVTRTGNILLDNFTDKVIKMTDEGIINWICHPKLLSFSSTRNGKMVKIDPIGFMYVYSGSLPSVNHKSNKNTVQLFLGINKPFYKKLKEKYKDNIFDIDKWMDNFLKENE